MNDVESRLAEIRERVDSLSPKADWSGTIVEDVRWLLAEVERLGVELKAMEDEHGCCTGAALVAQSQRIGAP